MISVDEVTYLKPMGVRGAQLISHAGFRTRRSKPIVDRVCTVRRPPEIKFPTKFAHKPTTIPFRSIKGVERNLRVSVNIFTRQTRQRGGHAHMSLLLSCRCTRLPRSAGGLAIKVSPQSSSSLRFHCVSRGYGTLPPSSCAAPLANKSFSTTAIEGQYRDYAFSRSSRFDVGFIPSRLRRGNRTTPLTRTIAKRGQHSAALESTADIDHAPILASYPEWIKPQDTLPRRHIGPTDDDIEVMLKELRLPDLDAFIAQTIPDSIRASKVFKIPSDQTPETEMLDELTKAGKANSAAEVDTYIGMGYHPNIIPGVIKRNVLENPGWYTSYTPYQPEISQGIKFKNLII
jgi:Glycine cleavage system P-protein